MASSSSSTSSTSSSSSATSTPSAARVLPTRAAAPAASAPLGVATGASASAPNFAPSATASASALNVATASTTTLGVSCSIRPPAPRDGTSWGGIFKNVPAPTNFFELRRRAGRPPNPAGLFRTRNSGAGSQNVSRPPSQDWAGWETAADPTSTLAPVRRSSTEGSSSSTSAWAKPFPWSTTLARPASAASSNTTPSPDITLVPNTSGSAPAMATSADTAPEPDAFTSNAPGVTTSAALEPDATTSTTPSAPGVAGIVDAVLEPDASASTPTSSTPGVAPSAIASTSAPGVSRSIPRPSKRRRRDSAPGVSRSILRPSKRRRRDSAPDSGGTSDWANLPADILEMVFVKLNGSALASAHVCYRWRMSAMTFPRPVVLCPAHSGRMELLVPTRVMPRGAHIAESVVVAGQRSRPFSYITLPALRYHSELRLIGGSPSVPLFIDDCNRRLVAYRFVGPPEELPNALSKTLLSIDLPEGVASHEIYYGIFVLDSSTNSFHLGEEINKIHGVLLATESKIFGIVKDSSRASQWTSVQIPLVGRQKDRRFITAASFGGLAYFMDQTHRLVVCNMDTFGVHTDEMFANINQLLDQHIKVLRTWIVHLSLGETSEDSGLLCLRYEYNHPRCFRFVAYDLAVGKDKRWCVRRELSEFCIFVGWGPGAEAFVYWHPERIGLASGAIYDAGQVMKPYFLGQAYRYNAMPPQGFLTWPFAIWIQQSFSVPYVPLPRSGIMPEALPPPAGDGAEAVEKGRGN